MTFSYVGQLITSVSFFGYAGMALFAIIAAVGITRSMSTNKEYWAVLFGTVCILIGVFTPNNMFSAVFGLVAIYVFTAGYLPVMSTVGKSNIIFLALVIFITYASILFAVGAIDISRITDPDAIMQDHWDTMLQNVSNDRGIANYRDSVSNLGLCLPGGGCEEEISIAGKILSWVVYDAVSIFLNIGAFVGLLVAIVLGVVFAPLLINQFILTNSLVVGNTTIYWITTIYLSIWNIVIAANLIKFLFNKRTT